MKIYLKHDKIEYNTVNVLYHNFACSEVVKGSIKIMSLLNLVMLDTIFSAILVLNQ